MLANWFFSNGMTFDASLRTKVNLCYVDLLIALTVAERFIRSVFATMSLFGQMGKHKCV